MQPLRALVLAAAVLALGVRPALAEPASEPSRSGSTGTAVLTLITQVGDDVFSTTNVAPLLDPTTTSTQHYGPFASSSPDSSTCGNNWAQDTFDRHFTVRNNRDGTFTVVEQFKNGAFTTFAGNSPGGCDTDPGGTIVAGKIGDLHGYEIITVTGMQTSQDASCIAGVPSAPCTTAGFVGSHFSGAAFAVSTFFFHYSAGDQSLAVGEWKNASCDRGGNQGDIASTAGPTGVVKSPLCA
ncbi:MAG TPA: hypothetical protein VKQ30_17530 [Ktedonobacterales bacterium]|nr:hypothetical protein [Ktedonobacterales bacterium]